MEKESATLGLEENVAALLCYVLGWISGGIMLLVEKDNRFVRFHASQSVAIFFPLSLLSYLGSQLPWIGGMISSLLLPLQLVAWILLMYKAVKGEKYKLPVFGDLAERNVKR